MARTRHLIGLLAVLSLALALGATPAGATGIGQNGRIAYSSGGDLYTINPDGTGLEHLLEQGEYAGNLREPAFSGDGSLIAFTSDAAGNDDVWVVDAEFETAPKRLTFTGGREFSPAFQPLGDTIAYVFEPGLPSADIWSIEADGSGNQPLVQTVADERDPAWSQSGTDLVFVRSTNPGGPGDLVKINPRGAVEELITSGPADDSEPSWSMGRIAFTRAEEGSLETELCQIKPDGSDLKQLTTTPSSELSPAGSPNGKQLAYVGTAGGQQRLLLGDSDATDVKPIANTPVGAVDPDWQPIFELNIQLIQKATNIDYQAFGTFAIVSFDTKYETKFPVVELWDGTAVYTGLGLGGPKDHWEITIAGLDPDTKHDVKIVMNKPGGGTVTNDPAPHLTTLQRNVTLTFTKVKVHSDSEASCGDFFFGFSLSAGEKINGDYVGSNEISICDGEVWDPNDIAIPLTDIDTDTVTGYVLGVDDDWDCVAVYCNEYDTLVGGGDYSFSSFKEDGEWAEKTFVEDVVPTDTESWTKKNTVYVKGGDDNELRFTWHYKLEVFYT